MLFSPFILLLFLGHACHQSYSQVAAFSSSVGSARPKKSTFRVPDEVDNSAEKEHTHKEEHTNGDQQQEYVVRESIPPTPIYIGSSDVHDTKSERLMLPAPIEKMGTAWVKKYRELESYKLTYGNCLVPKRYDDNRALGNWVNKQRVEYRKWKENQQHIMGTERMLTATSMTLERVHALDALGFCWDASRNNKKVERSSTLHFEKVWYRNFDHYAKHVESPIELPPKILDWANRQRKQYALRQRGQKNSLTDMRVAALDSINFCWNKKHERLWDKRYKELEEYKAQHGDCIVKLSYDCENKALARWVKTQRKNYQLRQMNRPNNLTDERIKRLEALGFAWDRYEYEFEKKLEDCVSKPFF